MIESDLPVAIFLLGPTASGKSELALKLAENFPVEIVSVDSAQVYRGMDIGTAKPDVETRRRIRHHLIDIVPPDERYSAGRFREDALAAMKGIVDRGRIPLLVGGTMLYFKVLREGLADLPGADCAVRAKIDERAASAGWPALHEELLALDPVAARRIDPNDSQRIQRALEVCILTRRRFSRVLRQNSETHLPYRVLAVALFPENRAKLHQLIEQRFARMLRLGLIEEVKLLRAQFNLTADIPSMRCVGYRQVCRYLEGDYTLETLEEKAVAATRQLAKRQLTWLRAMRGVERFDCFAADLHNRVVRFLKQAG